MAQFRVIGRDNDFVKNGVEFQVAAKTLRQSEAAFAYSCSMCSKDVCSEDRCAIRIAYDVAQKRMEEKAPLFFEKGVTKQKKAYCVSFATKNFEFSCKCCKTGGWDKFQTSCVNCPINREFTKNIKTLGGK